MRIYMKNLQKFKDNISDWEELLEVKYTLNAPDNDKEENEDENEEKKNESSHEETYEDQEINEKQLILNRLE